MSETGLSSTLPASTGSIISRRRRWRAIKDFLFRHLMGIGGIGVIVAIVLIFFYLLYVVAPLFRPVEAQRTASFTIPGARDSATLFLAVDEYGKIGLRVSQDGHALFYRLKDGAVIQDHALLADNGPVPSSFGHGDPDQAVLAFGLGDGRALVFKHQYKLSYPHDVRVVTPHIGYPLGQEAVTVDAQGHALKLLSVQSGEDETTIAALTDDGRLLLSNYTREESLMGDAAEVEAETTEVPLASAGQVIALALDVDQRELYVADDQGGISYFDVSDKSEPHLLDHVNAVPRGVAITRIEFLTGGISLLVGDSRGRITQWFPVRDDKNHYSLAEVRHFDAQTAPITDIAPEYHRKGFLAVDSSGMLGVYHTTAHRTLLTRKLSTTGLVKVAIGPRADRLVVLNKEHRIQAWDIHNEHPEVSWNSLWGKVWYESRQGPEYIWQSSSSSNDFEPKFSLAPLTFGTLKASFYAMLFAIPLGIMGAIYAAYFMSPAMRGMVKPTIEVMAALPTVILGFLAGLWLAPLMEHNLPGTLALMILLPLGTLVFARLWSLLPGSLRHRLPDGWEGALLIPVLVLLAALAFAIGTPLENLFFDGNMPHWLTTRLGIGFEQRNSLVVGLAMGFAVIPTIFSISEDAIFSVPKSLTQGSLALGATPWQTLMRVVLLTASPGIFSAVMIGLGRAVGETMIVLMATGNTPIMDFNIFEGFRALSANIAVEMPEAEVASTHYRVLFLAALVLFMITFIFNTAAELVRQRLREKYSSL